MAKYYLAPSLAELRAQINALWPTRDRQSDGWIGDISHQARVSDHNPDWNDDGVVRAIDVDVDGIQVGDLLEAVVGHEAVQYVIYNARITSRSWGWAWRPYTGPNPHKAHVHISIRHTSAAEHWAGDWFAGHLTNPEADPQVVAWQKHLEVEADGYWGEETDEWSQRLRSAARWYFAGAKAKIGFSMTRVQRVVDVKEDGDWGPQTRDALRAWIVRAQEILGVKADGDWGPNTDEVYKAFRRENLID